MKNKRLSYLLCFSMFFMMFSVNFNAMEINENCTEYSGDYSVKENMELYLSDTALQKYWKTDSSMKVSLSLEQADISRVYRGNGKSLKCSYTAVDSFSVYNNDTIYIEDKEGNPLGFDSRLGFYINSDCNTKLQIVANNSSMTSNIIKSKEILLSSGTDFIFLDWSDFSGLNNGVLDYLYNLKFVFTPESASGNIWIDQIGIEKTNTGTAKHGDSFLEQKLGENWVNRKSETTNIINSATEYYHSGETNLENDKTSLKVGYTGITNTVKASFYYNADLRINRNSRTDGAVSDNMYGEDTVLSLWVRADREINLELRYSDKNLTGVNILSSIFKTRLKVGENIINIPLKELMTGKDASYYWVYQLEFWLSALDSNAVSGNIYIDAIGFYNSDTENELSDKISAIKEISPQTAEEITDIIYFYTELTETEKKNITSKTLYSYNKLANEYYAFAPRVVMPDIINGSNIYNDGTLSFDIETNNNSGSELTVGDFGTVIYRKALTELPHRLDLNTPDSVSVYKSLTANKEYYRENIILKCFDDATDEQYEGYKQTDYIIRPYITYLDTDGNIFTVYGDVVDILSNRIRTEKENMENVVDGNTESAWEVDEAGTYSLYFDFDTPKTFNSIDFSEKSLGEYIYTNQDGNTVRTNTSIYGIVDFSIALSEDKKSWNTVYSQDEMGSRTVILDDTYTASHIRLTVTTDGRAGIYEASFKNTERFNKKLRVVSYVRMVEDITGYEQNIKALTDIILIDYGSWNQSGEFIFTEKNSDGGKGSESALAERVNAIKTINPQINIWYSLRSMILGENEKKTDVFSSTTDNDALVNTCLDICKKYGFYGIDFDFEYPEGEVQIENYNNFLIRLGTALHNNGYKFSIATSDFVVHNKSAQYIDYVNLMAYDRIGLDRFGRHNTYNAIYRQIERIMSNGFSKEQIVLGLGYYGRLNSGSEQITYKNLVKRYFDSTESGKNSYGSKYYCAGTAINADKVILALQKDLNGVFSWSLTTDLPLENKFSLAGSVDRTVKRFAVNN